MSVFLSSSTRTAFCAADIWKDTVSDKERMVAECIEIIKAWPGKTDSEKAELISRAKVASVAELKRCHKWKLQ